MLGVAAFIHSNGAAGAGVGGSEEHWGLSLLLYVGVTCGFARQVMYVFVGRKFAYYCVHATVMYKGNHRAPPRPQWGRSIHVSPQ